MTKTNETTYDGVMYNGTNFDAWSEGLNAYLGSKGLSYWLTHDLTDKQKDEYSAVKDAERCRAIFFFFINLLRYTNSISNQTPANEGSYSAGCLSTDPERPKETETQHHVYGNFRTLNWFHNPEAQPAGPGQLPTDIHFSLFFANERECRYSHV